MAPYWQPKTKRRALKRRRKMSTKVKRNQIMRLSNIIECTSQNFGRLDGLFSDSHYCSISVTRTRNRFTTCSWYPSLSVRMQCGVMVWRQVVNNKNQWIFLHLTHFFPMLLSLCIGIDTTRKLKTKISTTQSLADKHIYNIYLFSLFV